LEDLQIRGWVRVAGVADPGIAGIMAAYWVLQFVTEPQLNAENGCQNARSVTP
jgi:hypothetical protein